MHYCILCIKMSTLIYHSTAAKYDDRTNVSRKQNIASDWKQNMRLFTAAPTNRMEQSQILRQFLNGHVLVSQVFGGDFCSTYFGHLCGHETTCNEHLSSWFTKSSWTKSSQILKLYTFITILQWTSKCLLNRESVNLHSGNLLLAWCKPVHLTKRRSQSSTRLFFIRDGITVIVMHAASGFLLAWSYPSCVQDKLKLLRYQAIICWDSRRSIMTLASFDSLRAQDNAKSRKSSEQKSQVADVRLVTDSAPAFSLPENVLSEDKMAEEESFQSKSTTNPVTWNCYNFIFPSISANF